MSHPLRDAIPAGRCEHCNHFAPATGELGTCSRCACDRHVAASPYRGHDPETPPGAESALETYRDDLGKARRMLRQARDHEVLAKSARDAARRRAQLSPECPKIGVFDGVRTTVAYVEAWIDEQVADLEDAYQLAKVARQAAADHLNTLGEQSSIQQSIARSVGQSYMGQREPGW